MVKQNGAPVVPQPRLVDAIYSNNKQVFSAARANAILVVVESAHALLDVVIGVDPKTLRAMPVVNYARTVLAVILLIVRSLECSLGMRRLTNGIRKCVLQSTLPIQN